ncbi:pentatricopeptide repeat-containing protein At3g14730 isoform X1 [Beta vulgaris subsp. vulgaris]|uniref:pentatricopeptide repeat-containing protein At3g14730 isoform X1 n=2 Tax=Beta vulgaris subsp. vulgaris TaxID=3555 RepID=UPI002036C286|nr:pentatricopeptide repeat-containing protein At3g14730 isoform X1 [Beta vulgaris subsp. vulgaris]XP_048491952.1 pentatricopeptide repeat-containing protein At3g14730 isoform X1 [Beta vulgaris subsp. vulgaris]XP_048491955.1 pentatricopeptide repeat-containing protein At3g14730 isoform X1 [Beta vulgaris subsp. vulgaris]XP_048491956.1 pentatricopeptide repeat-containing protein At3g14730 isoform X1 [Beta vulgaris subsp. vulgaris]XP_057247741.1 pentatricopeptide repeat-containing protein At3g1473
MLHRKKILFSDAVAYFRHSFYRLKFASISSLQPSEPNVHTFPGCISFLQLFARHSNLYSGKELHSWMLKHDFLDSPLSITSLINMYSKCYHMPYALSVFLTSKNLHNVYTYNAIISGYVGNSLNEEGFQLYMYMRHQGVQPDKFTFPCAIKGCSEVVEVKKIHALLFKFGLGLDVYIGSALVNCYLKFRAMDEAYCVFDELIVRDVVLWNAMINGYVRIEEFRMALDIFRRMYKDDVMPNNFTATGVLSALAMSADVDNGCAVHCFVIKKGYESVVAVSNALIDMYGKCKCVDAAFRIFELMAEKDLFSWNTLISVHEQSGDHHGTLDLFHRMLDTGARPDLVTLTTVLPACSHLAALLHVKEIHRYMIVNGFGCSKNVDGFDNLLVNNALMDVYVKCGSMRYADRVFNKMDVRDVASWNIMIMGFGMHGLGNEALSMFDLMCSENIAPDEISFIGILSACSHGGFLTRGREYLSQMESVYGLVPTIEHYACVVDMLGRAGQLDEAYELLLTMPIESNAVIWRAFLAACRLHGNPYFAEVAAKHIYELDPEHCGSYVLMSNIYGASGQYEVVSDLRLTMKGQNIKKKPGYSWVEVNNSVHIFANGDHDHPEANSIYASLDSLIAPLCEHGYALSV